MPASHHARPAVHHPLGLEDANVVAAMRAQTAPFKGAVYGPAGREAYDAILNNVAAPKDVAFEAAVVGSVEGVWCQPAERRTDAVVLFLHGGGCVMGSARAYANFAGHFAQRLAAPVFVADYRLAPEHAFPAALEDAHAAYRGLSNAGATRVAVIGDSAGGGLSLSLLSLLQAKAANAAARPFAAVVMSPWTDLSMSGQSIVGKADEELYLTKAMLEACAAMYLGGAQAGHPQASVLNAPLAGLPPLQIHVGTSEILLDDSIRYFERASAAHADVALHVWEGMPHVFPNCPGVLQAADQALDVMTSFIADQLRRARGATP
ncbi:MAG TPA: alpha/beta hydrolase fold domain-containing protein [Burkholderiaceae bacterium]|jgi:acetyl esterase/lipase|nr:alpha/beta hydrolase fold domain-containing protein [Burkholderiaceae bacterium]